MKDIWTDTASEGLRYCSATPSRQDEHGEVASFHHIVNGLLLCSSLHHGRNHNRLGVVGCGREGRIRVQVHSPAHYVAQKHPMTQKKYANDQQDRELSTKGPGRIRLTTLIAHCLPYLPTVWL